MKAATSLVRGGSSAITVALAMTSNAMGRHRRMMWSIVRAGAIVRWGVADGMAASFMDGAMEGCCDQDDCGSELWHRCELFVEGRAGWLRASFYIDAIPKNLSGARAIASVFSVIRNASAPLGITTPGEPNVASTIWRTVYDQKDRVLYYDSATSPTVCWVPLGKVDFTAGQPVKRLPMKGGETYSGDASNAFSSAEAFPFLAAPPR
jgi:hypothetical protein